MCHMKSSESILSKVSPAMPASFRHQLEDQGNIKEQCIFIFTNNAITIVYESSQALA